MAHFDDIYEVAVDNYGLVTFAQAQELGVSHVELIRFVKNGRLNRLGQGVYKLTRYIPTPYDQYAEAVVLVGAESYIHGESVLAMHNLALVNPAKVSVAARKRTRKKLPKWIKVIAANDSDEVTNYEGIPSQSVTDALRYCKGRVMEERLADAIRAAVSAGLINEINASNLAEELGL